MPAVSVIIPVYNKWELTRNCLHSLAQFTPPDMANMLEVIVADNASTDETGVQLPTLGEKLFPGRFSHLRLPQNINFGPACNMGANHATGDILFFLNNDTILAENWLPPLLEAMEDPQVTGCGPLLLYQNNTVQHLGVIITPTGDKVGHLYARLPAAHPLAQKERDFPVITAAALMIRKLVFQEAGGFFPDFANGLEDVDLCLRLAAKGGKFRVVPKSVIYHLESQTPNRKAGESDNSALLRSRHPNMGHFSNMEAIAEQDGYVLDIDATLNPLFTPSPERIPALLAAIKSPSGSIQPDAALQVLEQEPYWEEGYVLLSQHLEEQGNIQEAWTVAYHSMQMNTGFRSTGRLLALTRKLPPSPFKAEILPGLAEAYNAYLAELNNKASYTARLQAAIAYLQGQNKHALAQKYEAAAWKK